MGTVVHTTVWFIVQKIGYYQPWQNLTAVFLILVMLTAGRLLSLACSFPVIDNFAQQLTDYIILQGPNKEFWITDGSIKVLLWQFWSFLEK